MNAATAHEQTFTQWLNDHGAILRQLSRVHALEPVDAAEELYQEMKAVDTELLPRLAALESRQQELAG